MHPEGWHHHHHLWPLGPLHLVILVVAWVLWIVPLYRILGRIGHSPWWAFVALVPPVGIVVLWVIAFSDWKTGGTKQTPSSE
jgi:hypothetical protein